MPRAKPGKPFLQAVADFAEQQILLPENQAYEIWVEHDDRGRFPTLTIRIALAGTRVKKRNQNRKPTAKGQDN